MAIQVRRGNESDFDASKMLPGEWAVSLDTRYVRMCFAPGIVLRMSTYDAFEADMSQIQAILAECRNIQSAVQRIQTEVNSKASLTVEYANDAKESADRAYSEAERAKIYADNAEAVTGVQIATKDRAGLIKGGNNHIAEDGTLMLITTTDSTTQPNSHAGREMVLEIGGVTEQGENPSPTNLQEIKKSVVSGVKTHGKNFWKISDYSSDDNGLVIKGSSDAQTITIKGTCTTDFCRAGIGTTFKLNPGTYKFFIFGDFNGTKFLYYDSILNNYHNNEITFIEPKDVSLGVNIPQNATVDTTLTFMCIRQGENEEYEPYTESSYTFSQPIELYGKDGVQDVITPQNVERAWAEYTVPSTISVTLYDDVDGISRYRVNASPKAVDNDAHLLSEYFSSGYTLQEINTMKLPYKTCIYAKELWFTTQRGEYTAVAFKEFIVGKKIYYTLEAKTTEALPIADQIALNSLATYDGITYVEFDSEIQPTFKGEYGTSKVGGYTLESLLTARNNELKQELANERLSALEASVVNNI